MTPKFNELPVDILRMIASFLDYADKARLVETCGRVYEVVNPVLWSSMRGFSFLWQLLPEDLCQWYKLGDKLIFRTSRPLQKKDLERLYCMTAQIRRLCALDMFEEPSFSPFLISALMRGQTNMFPCLTHLEISIRPVTPLITLALVPSLKAVRIFWIDPPVRATDRERRLQEGLHIADTISGLTTLPELESIALDTTRNGHLGTRDNMVAFALETLLSTHGERLTSITLGQYFYAANIFNILAGLQKLTDLELSGWVCPRPREIRHGSEDNEDEMAISLGFPNLSQLTLRAAHPELLRMISLQGAPLDAVEICTNDEDSFDVLGEPLLEAPDTVKTFRCTIYSLRTAPRFKLQDVSPLRNLLELQLDGIPLCDEDIQFVVGEWPNLNVLRLAAGALSEKETTLDCLAIISKGLPRIRQLGVHIFHTGDLQQLHNVVRCDLLEDFEVGMILYDESDVWSDAVATALLKMQPRPGVASKWVYVAISDAHDLECDEYCAEDWNEVKRMISDMDI